MGEGLVSRRGRHRDPVRGRGARWAATALLAFACALALASVWPADDAPRPDATAVSTDPPEASGADDRRPRVATSARPQAAEPTAVPTAGTGTFASASGETERVGQGGRLVDYRVEVEGGLGVDENDFAGAVDATLSERRGWTAGGAFSFRRTGDAPLRVVLASPATTDLLCAPLQTRGEVSCRNGNDVVINALRWASGVPHYDDLAEYRDYVINHEVGHALGFGHESCPAPGRPAPVMLQQTLGLQGCEPNPWP